MQTLDAAKVFSAASQRLVEQGFSVEAIDDFDRISGYLEEVEKPYLVPVNDPYLNDFTYQNCMWLRLSRGGKTVGVVCSRMDDTGDESVGDFWARTYRRHYKDEYGDPVFRFMDNDLLGGMSGKVVYLGDLAISKDFRFRKSHVVLSSLAWVVQSLVYLKWNPDWVYAFLWPTDAERGAAVHYQFERCHQRVKLWSKSDGPRDDDEKLACNSRKDLARILRNEAIASAPILLGRGQDLGGSADVEDEVTTSRAS